MKDQRSRDGDVYSNGRLKGDCVSCEKLSYHKSRLHGETKALLTGLHRDVFEIDAFVLVVRSRFLPGEHQSITM